MASPQAIIALTRLCEAFEESERLGSEPYLRADVAAEHPFGF